jgi:hypothetical protein
VIVAGRYGSLTHEGISYTEKEYRFADEANIPILAFLHRDPSAIPAGKSDIDPELRKRLETFRELCAKKMSKSWEAVSDLRASVTTSLVSAMRKYQRVGWIRANYVPDADAAQTILQLRNTIDDLTKKVQAFQQKASAKAVGPLPGEDGPFTMKYTSIAGSSLEFTRPLVEYFKELGLELYEYLSFAQIKGQLRTWINARVVSSVDNLDERDMKELLLRFQSLNLVTVVQQQGTPKWVLTPFGEKHFLRVKGISVASGN